jgi:translocation and assembly module TamA
MTLRGVSGRLLCGLCAGALAAVLGGCASFDFPDLDSAKRAVAGAVGKTGGAETSVFRLEIRAPEPLRKLLANHLDLARFQSAPAAEGIDDSELERLMRAAPAQARELLETEGHFNAAVGVERIPGAGLPLLRMTVTPGPRTTVDAVAFSATGALDDAARAGDAGAVAALAQWRRQWSMPSGAAFTQGGWADAKSSALSQLRAAGYATATWGSETRARVDAPANRASLSVALDSGPLFRLGPIRIEGLERFDADSVRKLATFSVGTPYTEKLLVEFQERLQKVGLFEGASVELDADPATALAAPVMVRVKELTLQQATVGVGFSANTGARLSLEHWHRSVFSTRWTARNKFQLGPTEQSWEGDLTSHPLDGLYRNLLSGSVSHLDAADEKLVSMKLRAGRTQDTTRIERLYFVELTQARLSSPALVNNGDAASVNYHWVYRDIDSVLLPTQGLTVSLQAALGHSRGTLTVGSGPQQDASGPFGRAYGRFTWYEPLGGSWFSTFRIEAGEVFTKDVIGMPDTLLFRAGGDDSVRGYGYRTLGPVVNGTVTSGRTLLTGSAEIARPISAAYPAFWWAAFVDAGQAADRWTDLRPDFGYGVGLRWRSPVGPLRLDVAYGEAVRKARVHFSIGIAF